MRKRSLTDLEKLFPKRAVAALNAASRRAAAAGLPRVLVIGNGLYRISPSGSKELIRKLPPRIKVRLRSKKAKV